VAIGSIGGIAAALKAGAAAPTPAVPAVGASGAGGGFGTSISGALDSLAATQGKADQLAVQAATGDLQDASDFMIAATQASLATELTVAVRNKAIESFQSIMNMGV
jgi:flagellar hook-basal body complex protein FliE